MSTAKVSRVVSALSLNSLLQSLTFPDRDHEIRNAWIGPAYPLDLSTLPLRSDEIPLQYPSLSKLSVSSAATYVSYVSQSSGIRPQPQA